MFNSLRNAVDTLPNQDLIPNQPHQVGITEDEFIDRVLSYLMVSCMLPPILKDIEIRRIVTTQVLPWFYRKYGKATQTCYYYVPAKTFRLAAGNQPSYYCYMPKEVEYVTYSPFITNQSRLFSIGANPAIMNVEIGLNQAYTPSFITSLGDFGIYRLALDAFSDELNAQRKNTLRYDFSPDSKRLSVLTSIPDDSGLVIECQAQVPAEYLFENDMFYKMTCGYALQSVAMMGSRFTIPLPGEAQLNVTELRSVGDTMVKEVMDEINGQSNASFIYFSRR